jgi:hyaluronoglucosaminidase
MVRKRFSVRKGKLLVSRRYVRLHSGGFESLTFLTSLDTKFSTLQNDMSACSRFQRRGIVEGFFGPLWSMSHRASVFEFGAPRGMNTYLYAPKDDPYHRARWTLPYPPRQWEALLKLIRQAQKHRIDFVYGFHPGKGLCFSKNQPIRTLLAKAQRFYDSGVRTFAVLFDDIPSRLEHAIDRKVFKRSLARAEAIWLGEIQARQPTAWGDVEWWICPSYYTPDPLLARMFGAFEADFLETLAEHLPWNVACFWTGPAVVSKTITLTHVRDIARRIKCRLMIWDNYPVNDLSMRDELHIGPLEGRDRRLCQVVYGYLSNPLLQEELSLIPLATCLDYSASPGTYVPETSWGRIIKERFGSKAVSHWRTIRKFCQASQQSKKTKRPVRLGANDLIHLKAASAYIQAHAKQKWAREIEPWQDLMLKTLN